MDWVKMMLKNQFLGCESLTYTDLKTGDKTDRMELRSTHKLDKGEAMQFITQCLEWAQSIACDIKVPEDSDYMRAMRSQNE